MPKNEDNNSDFSENYKDTMMRNFALLTLPWLSFQRDMLAIVQKGIEDTSHAKPVQKLTLLELHALMMIVDPTRTWRSPFDGDLEKRLEDAYKESFPKLVSGSVSLIEAQDKILKHISDALVALKNGNRAKSHTRRKQTD